jgi:transcriptional regulator with XRE-family HTH domain
MESFEVRLVRAVKRKREREGLSLRALSDVVGVSFSTLARIERGDGAPDNNSKIRLLEWLGPDAEQEGLTFENVAFVHFRAGKNVTSPTVRSLLHAGSCLKQALSSRSSPDDEAASGRHYEHPDPVPHSKEDLERIAQGFREELGLADDEPLDSLVLDVEDVHIVRLTQTNCLDAPTVKRLSTQACGEWSAMSVPLDENQGRWAILLNDCHTLERQRVTLLEEIWHILQGHKLTKIAKIAGSYGRTFESAEEHDAYYLGSATLLPRSAMIDAVRNKLSSEEIAKRFGTSPELVDYRLKRLGLWRDHVGKKVSLAG